MLATVVAVAAPGALLAASTAFTYDETGRVRTARYDNGACVVYAYDASGNRTSQVISSGGAPTTPTWGTGTFGCFYWTP
ncbi:MAG: RHS repeat protein [Reyranella sp.]|uniref:RHS repeat domain-containing protein n=1 Tax=Reyranella sp. TaxID=1929291 RepID=UPI001ACDFAA6|nr:RHS repeat domain-containing protein [Reyranella sp.]MBN9090211.1 RHS repeat protein [Reyranella sp.]